MVLPIAATLLGAAPLVVVLPFQVDSREPADADLGLAMQSLMVHELSAVMIKARTEDVDVRDLGKLEGATHVATGNIMRLGKQVVVNARLLDPRDNKVLATTKLSGPGVWNDRRRFTSAILGALEAPLPARPDGYDVNEELARAWGGALRALQAGAPKVAKEKLAALVAKWPKFMPAKAELAKL